MAKNLEQEIMICDTNKGWRVVPPEIKSKDKYFKRLQDAAYFCSKHYVGSTFIFVGDKDDRDLFMDTYTQAVREYVCELETDNRK